MFKVIGRHALRSAQNFSGKLRYERYQKKLKSNGTHTADAIVKDKEIQIVAGPASFNIKVIRGDWTPPQVYDFAAFGLAALSMSQGCEIKVDMPISKSAAQNFDHLANVYRLWSIKSLSKQRLEFSNLVSPDPCERSSGSILCLSGGVDSIFAATVAAEEGSLAAFLLIAGADYKNANEKGFTELQDRVSSVASIFGRELNVVETDIRQRGFEFDMLHGFNLASCLHFFSSTFESGAYALDNTMYQDVVRNPWGNNAALPPLFSTEDFAIRGIGKFTNRVEKIKKIYQYNPDLINFLSVCYKDSTIGGNCGQCRKCAETRLAFFALGICDSNVFLAHPPLDKAIDMFEVPQKLSAVKGQLVRTTELVDALPKGVVKAKLQSFEEEVRKMYLTLDPHR